MRGVVGTPLHINVNTVEAEDQVMIQKPQKIINTRETTQRLIIAIVFVKQTILSSLHQVLTQVIVSYNNNISNNTIMILSSHKGSH